MQFKVPQFLEIEDKIFGPFTFREFVYLAGGAGICYMIFRLLGFWLGALPIAAVAGFSIALTFYKPNGKPFIDMVEAGTKFLFQDKLYIWKRRMVTRGEESPQMIPVEKNPAHPSGARLSGSKLKDLAWSLDVLDMKK